MIYPHVISAPASLDPDAGSDILSQGYSLPTLMSSSPPSVSDLRMDILILSSFLDSKQSFPSTLHPVDQTLALYSNISTLLAIGNSRNPRAQNVNAVMGTINLEADAADMEFLVCAENARKTEVDQTTSDEEQEADRKKADNPDAGNNANKYGNLVPMFRRKNPTRVVRVGRDFLDNWDTKTMNMDDADEDKCVLVFFVSTINNLRPCSQ